MNLLAKVQKGSPEKTKEYYDRLVVDIDRQIEAEKSELKALKQSRGVSILDGASVDEINSDLRAREDKISALEETKREADKRSIALSVEQDAAQIKKIHRFLCDEMAALHDALVNVAKLYGGVIARDREFGSISGRLRQRGRADLDVPNPMHELRRMYAEDPNFGGTSFAEGTSQTRNAYFPLPMFRQLSCVPYFGPADVVGEPHAPMVEFLGRIRNLKL